MDVGVRDRLITLPLAHARGVITVFGGSDHGMTAPTTRAMNSRDDLYLRMEAQP